MSYKKPGDSEHSFGSDKTNRSVKTARMKARKLFSKRNETKVLHENYDVTPSLLKAIGKYSTTKKERDRKSISQIDVLKSQHGMFGSLTSVAQLQSYIQSANVSFGATSSFISVIKTDTEDIIDTGSLFKLSEEAVHEPDTGSLKPEMAMPAKASITLSETHVFYLLEISSISAEKDTEDGDIVEKDNADYDYLTVGKGRNRKTTNAEVQTADILLKSRFTYAERSKRKNNHAFASGWDMEDTYQNKVTEVKQRDIMPIMLEPTDPDYPKFCQDAEAQMKKLMRNVNFQNALVIIERILANNVFNHEQKRFRGLIEQDPFRPDIEFKYRLELLWTFKNAGTEGHPVTAMHWNPNNKDILAVGYGKFFYSDNKNGFVYCWNIKNPRQPEREYYYNKSVTAVAFSNFDPNLLAVGLHDGLINVLDISTKDMKLIYTTSPTWSPSHEPVWQVIWLPPDDYHPDDEYLVCVTEDGRVCRLVGAKTNEFTALPLMRVIPIEGKVKGVYQPRHCPVSDVPISKCAAALLITKHLADKDIYYIGTDEGTVHKCSRNYLNQHIDMFLAHNGPVYSCEFSPFCNKLFLTCGADGWTNIWAESITIPLITLRKTMDAVEGATWSTANSTVIANIVGNEIYLWDLQRRTYFPASIHKSPTSCRNTRIQFTDSGRNLVVSDIEGNVHIFALEDMPFPPFYQAAMLTQVIRKTLVTREDLISQLDGLGSLNY